MKIDSTGSVRSSARGSKSKAGQSVKGSGFTDHLSPQADSPGAVGSAAPTQSVGALVAIQGVPDSTEGPANARARQWGNDALDQLEQIRLDLLMGAIPMDRLTNLAQMVARRRKDATDPYLNSLLDDVELRVRVEMAKYEPRRNAARL
ncbi:MAG: flagellar assembly protein FliX [Alphaproteobacteria bacterium]